MHISISTRNRIRIGLATAAGATVASLTIPGGVHAATVGLPAHGQVSNPGTSVTGQDPANSDLTGGALKPGTAPAPWAIFSQTAGSDHDQVFVRAYSGGKWVTKGHGTDGGVTSGAASTFSGSLNFDQAQDGEAPSVDFAGTGDDVPWATWYENTSGADFGANNIFASRFNSSTNHWQFAGQSRGLGLNSVEVPSLNINTDADARNPAVASGHITATADPLPWITWQEVDNGHDQIFVTRAIKTVNPTCPVGTKPIGGTPDNGFCWQQVGTDRVNDTDPSLNVDRNRDAANPDIAFSGQSDTVPWVVWSESSAGSPGLANNDMVFAAEGVSDGFADGAMHWRVVGRRTASDLDALDNSTAGSACAATATAEATCALNKDAGGYANEPQVASGTMTPAGATGPWIAWSESNGLTVEVYVARLVSGNHFVIVNNGKPISTNKDHATRPSITFDGNTPYVSWRSSAIGRADQEVIGHFVNAADPKFVKDTSLKIASSATADVRSPMSSTCAPTPFNLDGSKCIGGLLGTPISLRTVGTSVRGLFAAAYQPAKPVTKPATAIRVKSATLHAGVNPGGAVVRIRFDYGPNKHYSRHTKFRRLAPADSAKAVAAALSGLTPNNKVHYRIEVRTDFAVLFGADHTFQDEKAVTLTNLTDESDPIGSIDLAATTFYTVDLDAAVAWYADKLGWQPISTGTDGHPYAVFRLGGSIVVLEPIEAALEPAPPGSESTTINLVVKRDADQIRTELVERGVTCGEIVESPGFRSFLIRDLDGNRYYIAQSR